MDIVQAVLEKQQKDLEKFKSISVDKHLECNIDLSFLMCSDPNDIDEVQLKNNKEQYLTDLTRDNVQLIVNELWECPVERVEETVVAKLPDPKLILPRARKVPDGPLLTKWQKFAKEKGIQKKKKDKKEYDQELNKWVPTYGFKHAEAEKSKEWVLEVPQTADPYEDQFEKKKDLKNEKVAKNEIQRMKNIARAKKQMIPKTGYLGVEAASSLDLRKAAVIAKASTASVGKFQEKLAKDKPAQGLGVKDLIPGAKRKASHIASVEKEINLELANSVLRKRPKLDEDKAFQVQKREERQERDEEANGEGKSRRKGKAKNIKNRKMGKKPKGGQGNRNTSKRPSTGRKRR